MAITNNTEIPSHETSETIERLRQLFRYYGESQIKFGKRFNLDQSYLSVIFKGQRKISGTVIKSMARLNVDITWLYTGKGEMFTGQGNVRSTNQESSEVLDLKSDLILSLKGQVGQLNDALKRSEEIIRNIDNRG